MAKKWAWISGWGIAPEAFKSACEANYPEYLHYVFPPTESALDQALAVEPDMLGAYSLGSLILLCQLSKVPDEMDCHLIAPILSFCRENNLGGTTPTDSLQMIQKRLMTSPERTLGIFYKLAGLTEASSPELPYALNDLAWGLETLKSTHAAIPDRKLNVVVGAQDPLLMAYKLNAYFPQLRTIQAGHNYQDLLMHLLPQR